MAFVVVVAGRAFHLVLRVVDARAVDRFDPLGLGVGCGGGTTTTFTWDVAGGLPTVIDDGAQYVYGPSGLVVQKQGANKYYYLTDGLGSVMKTTNSPAPS